MSYILDALKKADQERELGEIPDLETAHWGMRRKQAGSRRWVWAVAALLVFNGLLLAVLLVRGGPDEPVEAVRSPVDGVERAERTATPVPRKPVTQAPPVTTRPRVKVSPPVAYPATRPAPVASPRVQFAPQVKKQPAPASSAEFDVPEWRELPLEFRSRLTLPRIDVHVYAEEPRRRFIMADLKKYREGETLDNGAVLEKIHPGSIQLNYQGTRFRVDR